MSEEKKPIFVKKGDIITREMMDEATNYKYTDFLSKGSYAVVIVGGNYGLINLTTFNSWEAYRIISVEDHPFEVDLRILVNL